MVGVFDNVMIIDKDSHTFESGDTIYRFNAANGQGQQVRVECDFATWGDLIPLMKRYDMEIDFFSVGYNLRCNLVRAAERD